MCGLSNLQDSHGAADTSAKLCLCLTASDLQRVTGVDIMANLHLRNFAKALRDRLQGRAHAKHRPRGSSANLWLGRGHFCAGGHSLTEQSATAGGWLCAYPWQSG